MNDVQRKECVRLLSEMLFTLTVKHPVRADLEVIVHKCESFVEVVVAAAEDQLNMIAAVEDRLNMIDAESAAKEQEY